PARLVALRDQHGTRPHGAERDRRGRDARRPLVGRERDECHRQYPPVPWPCVPGPCVFGFGVPPGTGSTPPPGSSPAGFPDGAAAFVPAGISAIATAPADAACVTCAASAGRT